MNTARRPRDMGQTLVEFVMVAPLFFALLVGVIEGGRYAFYAQHLHHATREGARYQVVHGSASLDPTGPPDGADIKQAVIDAATVFVLEPDDIQLDWNPNNNHRGTTITVSAAYTFQPIIALFGPLTVTAESSLVINN
ncbi:MAG: pilus assembly protein [Actinomycetota bacterium]|nr:pilus assembly protein [Actinomycetota bacterium]